jgi:hypothetical protein
MKVFPRGTETREGERNQALPVTRKTIPALVVFSCFCLATAAGKSTASLDTQLAILLDALCHCKVTGSTGRSFVIAIVHDKNVSDETIEEVKAAFDRQKGKQVGGKAVSTVVVPFEGLDDLTEKLRLIRARGVFLTENNEKIVREVLCATRALKIISISNVPDYIHWLGVTLGVEAEGRKPKIMVNLASCQHEQIKFDEKVLANASVYF